MMETLDTDADGRVLPDIAWPELQAFWDALSDGRLVVPRCTNCEHYQWYPQAMCPVCLHQAFEWTEVAPSGEVFSFTTLRRSFVPELSDSLPLAIVLVDLDSAKGVRMIMNYVGSKPLSIGARVQIARTRASGVFIPIARPG